MSKEETIMTDRPSRFPGWRRVYSLTIGVLFGLSGVLLVLQSIGAIPITIPIRIAPLEAIAFGSILFGAGVWAAFEGVTSAWGRTSPLYQWVGLLFRVGTGLVVVFFWFLFWLQARSAGPDGARQSNFVLIFCGLVLPALAAHTIRGVRRILGKRTNPDQSQDGGRE
jgi:hypothetical protein